MKQNIIGGVLIIILLAFGAVSQDRNYYNDMFSNEYVEENRIIVEGGNVGALRLDGTEDNFPVPTDPNTRLFVDGQEVTMDYWAQRDGGEWHHCAIIRMEGEL